MKLCPNCQFENFKNTECCERCLAPINNIKNEDFQMFDFIKRNSAIYIVIGVLLAFVNYLSKPEDSLRTGSSLISALLAIFLICVLIFKSWDYCLTSRPCNNALKVFTYTFIHFFLIFSIFLFYGITYLPIISLFIGLLSGLIIPSELREQLRKRISIGITLLCVIILILIYLSTIFIWDILPKTDENSINYLIIASSMLFLSMGGIISSTFVITIFTSGSERKFVKNFFENLNLDEISPTYQTIFGFFVLLLLIFFTMSLK